MLTLSDIETQVGGNMGSIYSDIYKDVYGCRPRGSTFESIEKFNEDFDWLCSQNDKQMEEEKFIEAARADRFIARVSDIQSTVIGSSKEDAIRYIIQAEDKEKDVEFYGYEALEYKLGLKFGFIKEFIS